MQAPSEFANRFLVERELTDGERAAIYRGKDQAQNGKGVLLYVSPLGRVSQARIERAERQAAEISRLGHPMLVPILGAGVEHGCFYLASPAVTAQSLRVTLELREEPVSLETALGVFFAAAELLEALHDNTLVHGRLSTDAILLHEQGLYIGSYLPTALDEADLKNFVEERMRVAPAYLAPEIMRGSPLSPSIDIYALAVLLYELSTGESPPAAVLTAHGVRRQEPTFPAKLNRRIPPLLDAAILKGLSENPDERFTDVAEFVTLVKAGCEQHRISPHKLQGGGAQVAVGDSAEEPAVQPVKKRVPPPKEAIVHRVLEVDSSKVEQNTDRSREASLIVLNGPYRGERYWIESDLVMIGSDPQSGIHLEGDDIAARHAVLTIHDGAQVVNGLQHEIVVNGEVVEGNTEVLLRHGDVLQIGKHKLRYIEPENRAAPRRESPTQPHTIPPLTDPTGHEEPPVEEAAVPEEDAAFAEETSPLVDDFAYEDEPPARSPALFALIGLLSAAVVALLALFVWQVRSLNSGGRPTALVGTDQAAGAGGTEAQPQVNSTWRTEARLVGTRPNPIQRPGVKGELIRKVREYRALGQLTEPRGANALEVLREFARRYPGDLEVPRVLHEMAADAVHFGDVARQSGNLQRMKRAYLSARTLGVNSTYLRERVIGDNPAHQDSSEFKAVLAAPDGAVPVQLRQEELNRLVLALRTAAQG